jgi:hypothetical protein
VDPDTDIPWKQEPPAESEGDPDPAALEIPAKTAFRHARPTYGLGAAEHARARTLIERLFGARLGASASLRRLARAITRHRGGAVPIDRVEQVWLVRRFVEEGAAELEAEDGWEGGAELCRAPMPPLKPPGIAMQDAMRRAREYHATPGWYERYGKVGLHAETQIKGQLPGEESTR